MNDDIVLKVKERYGAAARGAEGCGCAPQGCCGDGSVADQARAMGYGDRDIESAGEGNLGLGCGNPLALAEIRAGMTARASTRSSRPSASGPKVASSAST